MRFVTTALLASSLCATAYSSQDQIVLDGGLEPQTRSKNVAIIGERSTDRHDNSLV